MERHPTEKPSSRTFQVVFGIAAVSYVMRNVLNGVFRFARAAPDWSLMAVDPDLAETISAETPFDGAIVEGSRNVRRRSRKALRGRKTVELCLDAGSIARLAAGHFLERGFGHYAFVEPPRSPSWATERREAFRRELADHGLVCAVYRPPSRSDLSLHHRHLAEWLAAQPRPLAVLAAYDVEARTVLGA